MTPQKPSLTHPVAPGAQEALALTIVRVPSPWWAPDFLITRKFIGSIPQYARAPGLQHKADTLSTASRKSVTR